MLSFDWSELPTPLKCYILYYVKILQTIPPIVEINQNRYRMVIHELNDRFNKIVYPVTIMNNNGMSFREEMETSCVDMNGLFDFHTIVYHKQFPYLYDYRDNDGINYLLLWKYHIGNNHKKIAEDINESYKPTLFNRFKFSLYDDYKLS